MWDDCWQNLFFRGKAYAVMPDRHTAEAVMATLLQDPTFNALGILQISVMYQEVNSQKHVNLIKQRNESGCWIDGKKLLDKKPVLSIKIPDKAQSPVVEESISHVVYFEDDGTEETARQAFLKGEKPFISARTQTAKRDAVKVLYKIDNAYFLLHQSVIDGTYGLYDVSAMAPAIIERKYQKRSEGSLSSNFKKV